MVAYCPFEAKVSLTQMSSGSGFHSILRRAESLLGASSKPSPFLSHPFDAIHPHLTRVAF